jgi:hypothetical protein
MQVTFCNLAARTGIDCVQYWAVYPVAALRTCTSRSGIVFLKELVLPELDRRYRQIHFRSSHLNTHTTGPSPHSKPSFNLTQQRTAGRALPAHARQIPFWMRIARQCRVTMQSALHKVQRALHLNGWPRFTRPQLPNGLQFV